MALLFNAIALLCIFFTVRLIRQNLCFGLKYLTLRVLTFILLVNKRGIMKTTDLIPLILYQLADGDKYGYEIVKQIEDATSGTVIIKQPTLYSLLKKLEQGKFISSYWQDSEIGGKRHYYKLTDNGRAQLDTYPSFEQLVNEINQDDEIKLTPSPAQEEKMVVDKVEAPVTEVTSPIEENVEPQVDDTVVPIPIDITANIAPITLDINRTAPSTEEPANKPSDDDFEIDTLNTPTSNIVEVVDINNNVIESPARINIFDAIEPADMEAEPLAQSSATPIVEQLNTATEQSSTLDLKSEQQNSAFEPQSMESAETKPIEPISNKLYSKLTPNEELKAAIKEPSAETTYTPAAQQTEQIKYLNYVDIDVDLISIKRKKSLVKHIQKMALTCISLLIMFILSTMLVSKYSFGKLYYISAIAACAVLVLYPILLLKNLPKIRLKYCSTPFIYSTSRDFFIKLSLFLSLVVAIFAYNLTVVESVKSIFILANFANFWCPIMFSALLLLDFAYGAIIYKSYRK